jgi:hypothetical protein
MISYNLEVWKLVCLEDEFSPRVRIEVINEGTRVMPDPNRSRDTCFASILYHAIMLHTGCVNPLFPSKQEIIYYILVINEIFATSTLVIVQIL